MKRALLATTALFAITAHIQLALAADAETAGYVDYPTTFLSFEGGVVFDSSPSNVDFANIDDDDKLGVLDSLQPGDWGGQGRFELGQRLDSHWDYKVGLAGIFLTEDQTSGDFGSEVTGRHSEASQKTSLQIVDAEVGYRPDDLGQLQTRLSAGVRSLHATSETDWSYDGQAGIFGNDDKLGEFHDEIYAIGPRIGMDVTMPIESTGISLVGAAYGAALFGNVDSVYRYENSWNESSLTRSSDSQMIWNVEGMAGVSFDVGENAGLTLGYRAAEFGGLMVDRSKIGKGGGFSDDGSSSLLVHGPFARLTVEIP